MGDSAVTEVSLNSFGDGVDELTDVGSSGVYVGEVADDDGSSDEDEVVFAAQRRPPEKWDEGDQRVCGGGDTILN